MLNDGTTRRERALELLSYQQAKEPSHKINLLHVIQLHAGLVGHKALEVACDTEVEHIRTENKTKSGSVDVKVNVGDSQRHSGEKLKPGMVQINIGRNQRNFMGDFYESWSRITCGNADRSVKMIAPVRPHATRLSLVRRILSRTFLMMAATIFYQSSFINDS